MFLKRRTFEKIEKHLNNKSFASPCQMNLHYNTRFIIIWHSSNLTQIFPLNIIISWFDWFWFNYIKYFRSKIPIGIFYLYGFSKFFKRFHGKNAGLQGYLSIPTSNHQFYRIIFHFPFLFYLESHFLYTIMNSHTSILLIYLINKPFYWNRLIPSF